MASGKWCCLALGALGAVMVARVSAAVDLVRDGRPLATVVAVSASAPEGRAAAAERRRRRAEGEQGDEALAVQILVDWVKKMTDAELPVAQTAPAAGPVVYVGRAALQAGLALDDIPSPSREGLRILADQRCVLIAGQSETATVKAVCRFLEELGCRYFMDGPLGEVYPRTHTLAVKPLGITEKPGLLSRRPKGPSWRGGYWKLWNGAGGEDFNHAHAWGRYLAPGLFAEHPEFFAQGKDGQRHDVPWVCTSNPKLRRYFAQRVIEAIQSGTRHPSLSPSDGRGYCRCQACQAQDDPSMVEPSTGTVAVSRRYADFFDNVARQVAKVHPESVLCFYCYADYTQPPKLDRRLSPNLCAVIAPIRYCRLHGIGHQGCPSRVQQVAMIDGWGKLADRLGYYNYMYNLADATLPMFKFTACKKEFPYLADKGLACMTLEVISNWHIYGPHIYLGVRLAYDPRADADAIMEDYWQKFYGPRAAPLMKAYWLGIDRAMTELDCHSGGFYGLQQIYTPEFLRQCQALLHQAARAADDPIYRQRVALHAEGLQSAAQYRQICDAMARGQFGQAKDLFDRLVKRIDGLAEKGYANREYGTAYLSRFLARSIQQGAELTTPPNKVLQVLPELWHIRYDDQDQGEAKGFARPDADLSEWRSASTYHKTLSAQGLRETAILWYRTTFKAPESHGRLVLFFAEVDGLADVYVNGKRIPVAPYPEQTGDKKVGKPEKTDKPKTPTGWREGQARKRIPFEVDVTAAVHPGENVVVVRVDSREITELFLGGILRPVVLVEKR